MISLRQYLRASKDVLSKCVNADRTIHVVFGNQAGDCDSIVCSLLQGYYLFTTTSPPAQKDLIFPVLPIPESDFKLRGETAALLDKCGIPTSELIFMDQVKWGEVSVGKVTLVDHNVLSERMSFLEPHVCEIIDHHVDGELYKNTVPAESRTIDLVGSCATLVASNFIDRSDLFFKERNSVSETSEGAGGESNDSLISTLLFHTIVLDTVNLSPAAKKAKELDHKVASFFCDNYKLDRNKAFDFMQSIKFDRKFWHSLSTIDQLRLDYKEYQGKACRLGISSILLPLEELLQSPDSETFTSQTAEYMNSRGLDVLVVMTLHFCPESPGKPVRGMALAAKSLEDFNAFKNCILESSLSSEVIKEWAFDDNKLAVASFSQGNATASRKKVAPLLTALMSQEEDSTEK